MYNLKDAAILGIVSSLEKNNIISADDPTVEKVASYIAENVDFDPTNPQELQKVAVAFISILDKYAQSIDRPDNFLDDSDTFSALLEKIRTERNNVAKGVRGAGQSEMADKGLIGQLISEARSNNIGRKNNELDAIQTFSALLEKARTERNKVNKGKWNAGASDLADKGIIGETIAKKASNNVDLDSLIEYLQS